MIVAVHGRGQDPAYLVESVVRRLDDPGVAWILPRAVGGSWYPSSFLARVDANEPWLGDALAVLEAIENELVGASPDLVAWLGFSQGACLVAEHLARRPRRWGGAMVLTGGMLGPPGVPLQIDGTFDAMPVYLANSADDEWVPWSRTVETSDAFRAAGADVRVDLVRDRPHEISDAEMEVVAEMIGRLVTSGSSGSPVG